MKNIVAFAGSNNKNSINKELAAYAASLVNEAEVKLLDLNDFELPLYGLDYELENGIPENANKFLEIIKSCDGIILSLAEHNGSYTVAFKNIFDWMSRIDGKFWSKKPMLLMATSPGGRGGATVFETAKNSFKHMEGNIVSSFSLPSFNDNFSAGKIINNELNNVLLEKVLVFKKSL